MTSHETIAQGYQRYHRGKRIEQGGKVATRTGLAAGGAYGAAKYLGSGGKAGHNVGHRLFEELQFPLRFKQPGTRKVPGRVAKVIGERATGALNSVSKGIGTVVHGVGKAATAPIRAPLRFADRKLAPLAARFAASASRRKAALGVVRAGRRLGVGRWAPLAVGLGTAAAGVGGVMKFVGNRQIRRGHAESQRV